MRPGSMPPTRARSGRRGSSSRRCGSRDDVLELILANVRTPDIRRGDLRAQTRGQPAGRAAARASWSSGAGATTSSRRSRRSSPTPSGARARRCASCPTARYEAEREIEGDGVTDEDVPIRVAVDGRRRGADDRLRGHRRPGGRQRQLPALGHALGLLLRAAGAAALRRPGQRRHLRGARDRRARGLGRQRAVARRGRGRQRRDLAARSPTPCSPRSRRRSTCPPRARAR